MRQELSADVLSCDDFDRSLVVPALVMYQGFPGWLPKLIGYPPLILV